MTDSTVSPVPQTDDIERIKLAIREIAASIATFCIHVSKKGFELNFEYVPDIEVLEIRLNDEYISDPTNFTLIRLKPAANKIDDLSAWQDVHQNIDAVRTYIVDKHWSFINDR